MTEAIFFCLCSLEIPFVRTGLNLKCLGTTCFSQQHKKCSLPAVLQRGFNATSESSPIAPEKQKMYYMTGCEYSLILAIFLSIIHLGSPLTPLLFSGFIGGSIAHPGDCSRSSSRAQSSLTAWLGSLLLTIHQDAVLGPIPRQTHL